MKHLIKSSKRPNGAPLDRESVARRRAIILAVLATPVNDLPEEILSRVRQWHGGIDQQFDNIQNIVNVIAAHPAWPVPADAYELLLLKYGQLVPLLAKCRSSEGSSADRMRRSSLLKTLVALCLVDMKTWAHQMLAQGVMTADDVHQLGFLLLGEQGRHHSRVEPTNVTPAVKIKLISGEIVRVVADQSAGENAADVVHGWPHGVNYILISIVSVDDKKEVVHLISSRMHNDIKMPDGSRGKQFEVKVSFLKHTDDEPRFGNAPIFAMPLTTDDLIARVDEHAHEEYEEKLREVERQRLELEQLIKDMKEGKK